MTTTILATDLITTRPLFGFATGDTFVITANTQLVSTEVGYLYGSGSGVDVTIDGYVWLRGNERDILGVAVAATPVRFAGNDTITFGADAQITLVFDAPFGLANLALGQGSGGGPIGGTDIANYGRLTTIGGLGIDIDGGSNTISNFGTIDVRGGSFTFGSGNSDQVLNAGTLTGRNTAFGAVVTVDGSGNSINNTGTIIANGAFANGINVVAASGANTITNSGTIIASFGTGIQSTSATVILHNSGTIIGLTGVELSGPSHVIYNTGYIEGNVYFGAGTDYFRGIGGTVAGKIFGGDGADTYYTSDSNMDIVELAAGGSDTVNSTVNFRLAAEVEVLNLLGFAVTGVGNIADNTIIGNGADNRLWGLAGADSIVGGEGDDSIGGGDDNDTLVGADGDDWLRGAVGNDSLTAGGDNDTLIGAMGVDTLRGGVGDDSFVFARLSHSGTTAATSDLIADFVRGQDVIDLSGIDARTTNALPNDAFTFIGTAAFSNVAGQMRYSSAAGVTTLLMDVNGNGTADMTLRLTGTVVLTAQDFIL
jgi:Ca2+-binding RTX toxin-like protein